MMIVMHHNQSSKIKSILTHINPAAIIPSILVAVIHFRLSVLVGPQANIVFQRWFDSGTPATGMDAVIASIDSFLAKPIPTVFLARHPVYGPPTEWWIATAVNSVVWGTAIYACYRLSEWLFKRYVGERSA